MLPEGKIWNGGREKEENAKEKGKKVKDEGEIVIKGLNKYKMGK
jgi:hypothetical protein